MTRLRTLYALGLFAAFALAAGCGKKPDPTTQPGPGPGPTEPGPAPGPTGGDPPADKEKAAKADAAKRLKNLGIAMHKYHDTMGQFPAGIVGPKGELGLSWRVQLLPYLGKEEAELYKQFNQKESWDSETNKKLLAKLPEVFQSPGKESLEGKTYIRSFFAWPTIVVNGKLEPPYPNIAPGLPAPGLKTSSVTDGPSNTLLVVEAQDAVEWTKPEYLPFDEPVPVQENPAGPRFGGVFPGGFHGLMCDGRAHFFPATLSQATLSALRSIGGREVLPPEVDEILYPPERRKPPIYDRVPDSLPDAVARKTAVANYQKIVKGVWDYQDKWGYFPVGLTGPDKSIGLSWRVHLLPFIGEQGLFQQFRLGEPWDSEHNKKLIEKMPAVFTSPGKPADKGRTFVRTTQGPGGIIRMVAGKKGEMVVVGSNQPPGQPIPGRRMLGGFTDGTLNTILFVEAGEAVPWTRPDELYLPALGGPKDKSGSPKDVKLPPLGGVFPDGFHATMVYGTVTFYKTDYPAVELAKMFGPADGWEVNPLGHREKILYSIPRP